MKMTHVLLQLCNLIWLHVLMTNSTCIYIWLHEIICLSYCCKTRRFAWKTSITNTRYDVTQFGTITGNRNDGGKIKPKNSETA